MLLLGTLAQQGYFSEAIRGWPMQFIFMKPTDFAI
jgi:hypothetical protein